MKALNYYLCVLTAIYVPSTALKCQEKDSYWNDPIEHNEEVCGENCREIKGCETGTLTSPNFPNNYPNHTTCSWTLMTAHDHIIVDFKYFDVAYAKQCTVDYVAIGNWQMAVRRFCGYHKSPTTGIISKSNVMGIQFRSGGGAAAGQGFNLTYMGANCLCPPGYKFQNRVGFELNDSCVELCDTGYFGKGCLKKCDCKDCDAVTGECYNQTSEMGKQDIFPEINLTKIFHRDDKLDIQPPVVSREIGLGLGIFGLIICFIIILIIVFNRRVRLFFRLERTNRTIDSASQALNNQVHVWQKNLQTFRNTDKDGDDPLYDQLDESILDERFDTLDQSIMRPCDEYENIKCSSFSNSKHNPV